MELSAYVKEQIALNKSKLSDSSTKNDALAAAKLAFLESVQRVLNTQATPSDLGLMDAINDLLQQLKLVKRGETFYKK